MRAATHIQTLRRHPSILLRNYRPVLLLSHMRANTSLLGHILGSNPEVEGYYEMHIGYHSRKSLLRQRLLHFAEHRPKKGARYLFDKVLHDHAVDLELFRKGKVMFALRSPERTIPSIISLYRKVDPQHEFATEAGAVDYYVSRLACINQLAHNSPVDFLYLDAEALRFATITTLDTLTAFLHLKQPLSERYRTMPLTGRKRTGDSSEAIGLGKVTQLQRSYDDIVVPEWLQARARRAYRETRDGLINSPACSVCILMDQSGKD